MGDDFGGVTGWYTTHRDENGMWAAYRMGDEGVQHFTDFAKAVKHAQSGPRADGLPRGWERHALGAALTIDRPLPWYIRGSEYDRRRNGR